MALELHPSQVQLKVDSSGFHGVEAGAGTPGQEAA